MVRTCSAHVIVYVRPMVGSTSGPVTLTTHEVGTSVSPYATTLKWTGAEPPKGLKLPVGWGAVRTANKTGQSQARTPSWLR
jgi:hypothetical protein